MKGEQHRLSPELSSFSDSMKVTVFDKENKIRCDHDILVGWILDI
jgi:hypothetical protein